MIILDKNEQKWILRIKGHFKDLYPSTGQWHDTLKPLFTEFYGWNPDEDNNYHDYLKVLFNKLLSIHLKIKNDYSSENAQLEELFQSVFNKKFTYDPELPIERGIQTLCSFILGTRVVNDDGSKRFELFKP
jgi:hypothetical protein